VRFTEAPLPGVFVVELEPRGDERGLFARAFCAREFTEHGLVPDVAQMNLATNALAGTTRGLHYQDASAPEAKFFRCIRGETFNVVVDAREESATFGKWFGVHLSAANRLALYVPPLHAAGYQALVDGAEILYAASSSYAPDAEHGLRQDDPAIGITWPMQPTVVSEKDRAWLLLAERDG
jgi:dTDP-4-dehydrorhamnose 3,5-epimerase